MDAFTRNSLLTHLSHPHVLQTWQWGEVKAKYGWQPFHKVWRDEQEKVTAAALVLKREFKLGPIRACIHYVPKGPLLADWSDAALRQRVLSELADFARGHGSIFLKIDPDVRLGTGLPGEVGSRENPLGQEVVGELSSTGWLFSPDQIQFRNTVLLDLTASEEALLARMKQKTRYNIRLAGRRGVSVRHGTPSDFPPLYNLYAATALRDRFTIRHQAYYLDLWNTFFQASMLKSLVAEVEGEIVAGLMLFVFGDRAWYLFGMSSDDHREKMPNYLLQWQAMRAAKAAGCTSYDLWGAPDTFDETDPLWGVYRFKEGLGGQVVRHLGAWDFPLRPNLYSLYTRVLPRVLGLMRLRGRAQTRRQIGASL